jgi:uncharacterized protein with GYD domain
MAHFMFTASYTADGIKGVLADGPAKRMSAVERLFASVGGRLETAYWSFGHTDFIAIAELPDNAAAAAAATKVAASGVASIQTTVLLSAEDIDAAIAKDTDYQAPGA